MINYIIYKKLVDLSIEDAFTYLKKLSRKIINTQKDMHDLLINKRLLSTFLNFLFKKYIIIKDVIEAQKNLDLNLTIQKLLKKETQLKA